MYFFICFAVLFVASCNGDAAKERSSICTKRNMYLKVDGQCDSYTECRDYQATDLLCPDGLHYDPSAKWPAYPCGYPQDVQCVGRGASQPAISTDDCPHQFGYFPSPLVTPEDCGHYKLCSGGKAYEMSCTFGLAFNPDTARCDWADLVPSCDVDKYIGFICPAPELDSDGNPLVTNHKHDDCYSFFSCTNGIPRILSCDPGYAFDENSGRCEDADFVPCSKSATPN